MNVYVSKHVPWVKYLLIDLVPMINENRAS
jgi:hypothetical protein